MRVGDRTEDEETGDLARNIRSTRVRFRTSNAVQPGVIPEKVDSLTNQPANQTTNRLDPLRVSADGFMPCTVHSVGGGMS